MHSVCQQASVYALHADMCTAPSLSQVKPETVNKQWSDLIGPRLYELWFVT